MKIDLRLIFSWLLLVGMVSTASADFFSRADGTWSNTINGGPNCGCVPGQNDNITVNHNITIAGPFTVNNGSLTINAGTLTINGDLTFNNGSTVDIASTGSLHVTGNFLNKNNSNNIDIDGSVIIDGNFANGTGSGSGAIIDFGPGATIQIGGTCSNLGEVTQNGNPYANSCTGPLPITLIFFKGKQNASVVYLEWATATEQNFQYFSVEKAYADLKFKEIGTVEGSGQSQQRVDYEFTDAGPTEVGKVYYRLNAVDHDGYSEYFNVVAIDYKAEKTWSVYPNPSSGEQLVISRNFSDDEQACATIYDIQGNLIFTQWIDLTTSKFTIYPNLEQGVYVVKLSDSNAIRRFKIVVE